MPLDFSKSKNNTLLNTFKKSEETNTKIVREIPLGDLVETDTNEYIFGIMDSDVDRLAEEIQDHGFKGSIQVMDLKNGKYKIISGHQRYRAVKKLGWKTIPCIVSEPMSTEEQYRELIASNVLSRKITPLGYARAIDAFKREVLDKDVKIKGRKRAYIAHFFNIAEGQVIRYETITKMPPEIQEMCKNPDFPYSALEGSSAFTESQKQELLDKINAYNKMNAGTDAKISANTIRQFIESIKEKAAFQEELSRQEKAREQASRFREEDRREGSETEKDTSENINTPQANVPSSAIPEPEQAPMPFPMPEPSEPAEEESTYQGSIPSGQDGIPLNPAPETQPEPSAPFSSFTAYPENAVEPPKAISIDLLLKRTAHDLSGIAEANITADNLADVRQALNDCLVSLNEIKAKIDSL